ncbi:hypothetical protein [Stenotrophomonas maltophilia]|uniref:hypothetical protein n=1 Tax=Stenotrophomonas maltophilia TaxID=40324 RepID=UPI0015DD8DEB|nr:hypothetical protein [Stenotrophomonas maltophilia]MBA0288054.1 hypothetical protein [Stenotrophomonas maltophilia]MBA0326423.1 hypothetical protein [Stenotrophomonas maltophilia]
MPQPVETLPFDLASVPWRSIVAAGDLVAFRQLRAKGVPLAPLALVDLLEHLALTYGRLTPALETRWVPWVRHLVDAGAVLEDPRLRRAAKALASPRLWSALEAAGLSHQDNII